MEGSLFFLFLLPNTNIFDFSLFGSPIFHLVHKWKNLTVGFTFLALKTRKKNT
jgi:hypothetical protein